MVDTIIRELQRGASVESVEGAREGVRVRLGRDAGTLTLCVGVEPLVRALAAFVPLGEPGTVIGAVEVKRGK